jgi:hypothetical protein
MPSFTDKLGRCWVVDLTLGEIERVKAETGHDLSQPGAGDPPLLTRFQVDLSVRGAILWALCGPQARAQEIDLDGFLAGMDGPTLKASYEAVVTGLSDFFRSFQPGAAAWIEKMTEVTNHAAGLATEQIRTANAAQIATKAMEHATGTKPRTRRAQSKRATGSPAGSASTPGR